MHPPEPVGEAVTGTRLAVAVLLVFSALALPPAAMAGDPPVVDQYQEPFPTGGGNQHTGGNGDGGGSGSSGAELPSSTQTNLANSVSAPVAQALETVATSPELGAPQGTIGKEKRKAGAEEGSRTGPETAVVDVEPLSGSPLTDAVSSATDGGNTYVVAVLLVLAALTLAGVALAVARRRQPG
jgi:hypothetical protein